MRPWKNNDYEKWIQIIKQAHLIERQIGSKSTSQMKYKQFVIQKTSLNMETYPRDGTLAKSIWAD